LDDRSLTFLIFGGYQRYFDHAGIESGLFGYTAKFARPWSVFYDDRKEIDAINRSKDTQAEKEEKKAAIDIGDWPWSLNDRNELLKKLGLKLPQGTDIMSSDLWPYFHLLLHREAWAISSINIFVGWHRRTCEELLKQRLGNHLRCDIQPRLP
jgi:O-methyltransferase involved in polyketide biosynthesis